MLSDCNFETALKLQPPANFAKALRPYLALKPIHKSITGGYFISIRADKSETVTKGKETVNSSPGASIPLSL